MPEVSEEGKSIVKRVMGLFRSNEQTKDSIGKNSSSTEILSGIYKMLVQRETQRALDYKTDKKQNQAEERELEKRHREILKALSFKRPPKKQIEKKVAEEKPAKPTTPTKGEKPPEAASKTGAPKAEPPTAATPKAEQPKAATPKAEPPTTAAPKPSAEPPTAAAPKPSAEPPTAAAPKPSAEPPTAAAPKPSAEPVTTPKPTVTPKPVAEAPVAPKPISQTPVLPSVGKAVTGAALAGTMASAIGGAESGGKYDITFGDTLDKKGNVVRGPNLSPEKKFNGKNLTDLTLEEIDILGKERNRQAPNTSAMGKYQFMNSTLFGTYDKKGNFRPGLVQQKGYDLKNTKFTPTIQEELQKLLHEQDTATLKRLGVPLTPGYEYMAHYLGAGGAAAVYKQRNTDMTVEEALVAAGLKSPVQVNPKTGKLTNGELRTIKSSEFESVLNKRLQKQGLIPHAVDQPIDALSKENTEMKKDLQEQSASPQNVTNNITVPGTQTESKPNKVDDRSAFDRVTKGN
jgi:hypothetical protein